MSNLYKQQMNQSRNGIYTRVIDYNDLLEQKLSALTFEQEAKLRRQRLERLKQQRAEAAAKAGEEGADSEEAEGQKEEFIEGLPGDEFGDVPLELEIDYVERAKEEAEQIVSKASADAKEILERAVQEAENLKETARKQAEEKGYAEGMEHAQAEETKMLAQLDEQRMQQEQAYADRLAEMEPMLMDAVIEVFDQVLNTDFACRRKVLLHLIRRTVRSIKNSREFRIRISEQDYEAVAADREEILKKIGGEAVLDLVMDDSMQPGTCTIDTDEGVFDCGLDVQLENLTRDLKDLSCMD